ISAAGRQGEEAMSQVFVQLFIDPEKWDRAQWKGTAFITSPDPGIPPCLGLVFLDEKLGREIFKHWRQRLGDEDSYDELRVAIIEGDIPGEAPGYSVHISSEPLHTQKRLQAEGKGLDVEYSVVTSRIHRMNPVPGPGSPHLERF